MELYSVIKNDAPRGQKFAIWKFYGEDFKNGSQLIVNEAEEAIFVKDGMIQNIFSAGKYTLDTNNYPFITAFRSLASGGVSAFHCKVYFVNKSHFLDTKWGTDTPIQVRDPMYRISVSIQARGSYTLRVIDSKNFYLKFVGNGLEFVTQQDVMQQRRSPILQAIKTIIPKAISEAKVEILGISERQEEFAEIMKSKISGSLEDYGLGLVDFYVEALDIPMDDPNRVKLEGAFADKGVINVLGQDWGRQNASEILKMTASNPGAGGVASAGAGLGMGMAAGGIFGAMAQSMFTPMQQQQAVQTQKPMASRFAKKSVLEEITCPSCGVKVSAETKFCPNCGTKMEIPQGTVCACGAKIPAGSKFCPACGKKVKAQQEQICSCGAKIPNGSKFCPACGNPVNS